MVMQRISGDVRWGFENWFQDEKKSGSVVLDLHVHDLDFIRYMLGEPKSMDVKATEFPAEWSIRSLLPMNMMTLL